MKQLGNGARAKKICARFSFAEGICGQKLKNVHIHRIEQGKVVAKGVRGGGGGWVLVIPASVSLFMQTTYGRYEGEHDHDKVASALGL